MAFLPPIRSLLLLLLLLGSAFHHRAPISREDYISKRNNNRYTCCGSGLRKLKSKMSTNGRQVVNSPETLRKHQLLAAHLNHLHTAGASASDDDSGCGVEEFTWVPAGLSHAQVHQYMRSIPGYAVPLVGTTGDRNRIRRLLRQLPPHDNEARYCHVTLGDVEQRELSLFCQRRKREALGRGEVRPLAASNNPAKCIQCDGIILGGDLAVTASRAGPTVFWHPKCFVCVVCSDLLVDLIYFHGAGTGLVYCGRHHAETLKPRCAACDEIIFSDECTEAEGLSWHMEHFTCAECHTFLGGQRYVVRGPGTLELASGSGEERPPSVFCCDCYERCHADRCMSCSRPIRVDEGHMAHSGLHWHATDTCFSCDQCHSSLIGCSFVPQDGAVYCAACANESNSFARGRHYESNDAISESSNDFTISRQVATITQHLVQPCSPGGSISGYLGSDETTRRYSSLNIPEGRSVRSKVVSRGMASRYIEDSSDFSDDAANNQIQKIRHRRNPVNELLLLQENEPCVGERHQLATTHHLQHLKVLRSPPDIVRQIPDGRSTNCVTSSHSPMLQSNEYEEFEYADGGSPPDKTSETTGRGARTDVGTITNSVGASSPEVSASADEHKYYDVIEVQCCRDVESRNDEIGRRAAVTGSSQFVSESVRRYLEQAEAWDCHRRGRGGRRSTCSTCSSSSSDSSDFDYYLDRPSTTDEVINWGSGNRVLDQQKTSGTCTKQCVVS